MSMIPLRPLLLSLALLPATGAALAAQVAPAAPAANQAPVPATPPAIQSGPAPSRAGWFSDKRPMRVGDLVTIVVDEAVNSRERQTRNASAKRSQQMGLNLNVGPVAIGPKKGFESGVANDDRNTGEANRTGDLTATISVRVVSIEPSGIAHLKGEKTVGVDGRNQVITIEGVIRPEDLSAQNTVSSARIAESVITYKGKKIGPAKGILGSILSIFWP
ncbi:MAG: flagellar basal body L-ring protein FlgH [Gemmatimonadales bacterium]